MFRCTAWLEGQDVPSPLRAAQVAALLLALSSGCDRVIGLHDFSIDPQVSASVSGALHCSTHLDCQSDSTLRAATARTDFCHAGRCVALRSDECQTVTGPAAEPDAVIVGSLFAVSGAQPQANLARQQSAMLAVEQINAVGGVRVGTEDTRRPLALVSCDTAHDLSSATHHLVDELGVSAIVGSTGAQDALDVALLAGVEPGRSASHYDAPTTDASRWWMVPSDAQRAPLLGTRVQALEAQLHSARGARPLRLGIVSPAAAPLGAAAAALGNLVWNGAPVVDSSTLATSASVRFDELDSAGLVDEYVTFAPDVVVLLGTAASVSQLIAPLERNWRAAQRPQYVVTDASKVPELLSLARDDEDLRARVSGIGVRPTLESAPNQARFAQAYTQRFGQDPGAFIGTGQSYDAVYAFALALARGRAQTAAIGSSEHLPALRSLYGGTTTFALRPENLAPAQDALAHGQAIRALGSYAALHWDERGELLDGAIEVFCIASISGEPSYASAGLSFDVASNMVLGAFSPCQAVRAAAPTRAVEASEAPDAGLPECVACASDAAVQTPPAPSTATDDAGMLPPPIARNLACGDSTGCGSHAEDYCCITSSTAAPSCEREPRTCEHAFHCVRSSDCASGEQCCEQAGSATCIPAGDSCAGAQFACVTARDCPQGLQCCSHLTPDNSAYAATRCEAACDAAQNSAPLCETRLDCAAGETCRLSNYLPNLHVCDAAPRPATP